MEMGFPLLLWAKDDGRERGEDEASQKNQNFLSAILGHINLTTV
jgi:hypothetical protein